jgi:hypothetical protein
MVELGLCAKQEKADRFQHVKKEINEMVKMCVSQLKTKVMSSLYFSFLNCRYFLIMLRMMIIFCLDNLR